MTRSAYRLGVPIFGVLAFGMLVLGAGPARAQTTEDIDRQWCIQMQQSIERRYRAAEALKARREAAIARLRPQHRELAREQLDEWYFHRLADFREESRALRAECQPLFMPPRREGPIPRQSRPPEPPPQPPPQQTWRYRPYERYADPTDPFSPGAQR
jgi:hypothetical protein